MRNQPAQSSCANITGMRLWIGAQRSFGSVCSQTNCTDGAVPVFGQLLKANGVLYGTTEFGGAHSCFGEDGCGTVFSLDPTTGEEKTLYSFCAQMNCTDGAFPVTGLVDVNGTLYGTTFAGGARGGGTIFSITP